MLTLRDPSSFLAYLDSNKGFCEEVCLVVVFRYDDVDGRVRQVSARNLLQPM